MTHQSSTGISSEMQQCIDECARERMGKNDEMMQRCAEECRRCQQSCERMAA